MAKQTPSQTVGPFFAIQLTREQQNVMVNEGCQGERITVEGRVLDGNREPVLDALVEIWQADANGIYGHEADPRHAQADPAFGGFGRCDTVEGGRFWFKTIRPGAVPAPEGGMQAPHLNVTVFARGLLIHAVTRIYFEDEATNEHDPVLGALPAARRQTLIARREEAADGTTRYCIDVVLQGVGEMVFFEV